MKEERRGSSKIALGRENQSQTATEEDDGDWTREDDDRTEGACICTLTKPSGRKPMHVD